jgi:hypothetical protein
MKLVMEQKGLEGPALMPAFNKNDASTEEIIKSQQEYFKNIRIRRYQKSVKQVLSKLGLYWDM